MFVLVQAVVKYLNWKNEGDFLAFNSKRSLIITTVEMSGIHLGISEASFIVLLAQTSINQGYSSLTGPRKEGRRETEGI